MDEITKEEIKQLKRIVGFDKEGEHKKKPVKIIRDKKQLSIRIPKRFTEILEIDETKDYFEFHLIPKEEQKGEFKLEGFLVKG